MITNINLSQEELQAIFAKMTMLDADPADKLLAKHLLEITDSFNTLLIQTYYKADYWNKQRLLNEFDELRSVHRYHTEPGFIESFKKKFGL